MDDLTRREALDRLATLGTATAALACTRPEAQPMTATATAPQPPAAPAVAKDLVRGVRPLGFPWETADPFLFCVHHDDAYPAGNERMGPAVALTGRQLGSDFARKDGWSMYHGETVPGFPGHPHRGFETVTVVRKGLVDHSDSLGAAARYGDGDVQWLTAGGGIMHAEMFPLLRREVPNPLEVFQIWLNLPKVDKHAPPHFSMFWNADVPRHVVLDDGGRPTEVTVVAGRFGDGSKPAPLPPPRSWAARPDTDVAIWTIEMAAGAKWTLPPAAAGTNRRLYFYAGSDLRVADTVVQPRHAIELRADSPAPLVAGTLPVKLLLLQGRPIGEPVVQHGPFVMNTQAEIRQAYADYQRTRFGGWPWPADDPVHPRTEGRFARHADGRIERAG